MTQPPAKRFLQNFPMKAVLVAAAGVIAIGISASAFADDDGHHDRRGRHEHHRHDHRDHHSRPYIIATPGYGYAPPPVVYAPPPVVYAPPPPPAGINFVFPIRIH
jgi:hypothetical protein